MINLELLQQAVMDSRDGITISDASDPAMPLIFANPAFERMTGYDRSEVMGRNCRFLQGSARDEATCTRIRRALAFGHGCRVTLYNYRRDGSGFWNELSVSPIHDAHGKATHFIGIQSDITQRMLVERELRAYNHDLAQTKASLERLVAIDALTGVYNRRHFDDRLVALWKIAARNADPVALFFIDIDYFKRYNDRYGHPGGDRALVRVAETLADSFQRGSDFLARYGGEEFVVVANSMTREPAQQFAARLCERIHALNLPNPDAPAGRLTISVGYTVVVPTLATDAAEMIEAADQALYAAKRDGRNCAVEAPVIA